MSKQIEIYVDDDYYDLVPRPSKEQRKALKESMQKEGQQEPIVIDSTGRILDGHTRYDLCLELHLKPKYVIKDFKDEEEKKKYAVTVNLKRRHLNDYQIFELLQKEFERIRTQNQLERGKKIWESRQGKKEPFTYEEASRNKSLAKLSDMSGVGIHTLEQCRYIAYNGDKKIQKQVRDGTIGVTKGYERLRKITRLKADKGKTHRSKFGIVFDIMKSIKDSDKMRISIISRQTNLSHYATKENLDLLIKVNLVKIEKEILKGKYYKTKSDILFYKLTDKGQTYYQKCLELYDFLPKEFAEELQH